MPKTPQSFLFVYIQTFKTKMTVKVSKIENQKPSTYTLNALFVYIQTFKIKTTVKVKKLAKGVKLTPPLGVVPTVVVAVVVVISQLAKH